MLRLRHRPVDCNVSWGTLNDGMGLSLGVLTGGGGRVLLDEAAVADVLGLAGRAGSGGVEAAGGLGRAAGESGAEHCGRYRGMQRMQRVAMVLVRGVFD